MFKIISPILTPRYTLPSRGKRVGGPMPNAEPKRGLNLECRGRGKEEDLRRGSRGMWVKVI